MKNILKSQEETGNRRVCAHSLHQLFQHFFFSLLLFFTLSLHAQTYFQQDVKYIIHVSLNDMKNELTATESIAYTNNSPDVLPFLYFHIWPNAYRDNNSAMAKQMLENGSTTFYFSDDAYKGYIDDLNFKVNDTLIQWKPDSVNEDICKLMLNKPLKPGQTITITTPFHVKIPDSHFSRMGHDGQSYQISQWFPKPAVYDLNGWNAIPYLDQGEFYSEFGTFDVYITLPDNYVVAATGDLVDGEKELAWLENKVQETMLIKTYDKKDLAFPASSKQTKTLHYHQEKVHDFAWFSDKRYHVVKSEVELPDSKNKVTTWAMFTNRNAYVWKNGARYVKNAIYYYSKWIGEYPYKLATAVEGALSAGGGMEYPNVTVISEEGDSVALETVVVHEVGHNWFYGLLGSNERKHPWMDEGINSFYEYRYLQLKHPGSSMYLEKAAKLIHLPANSDRVERYLLYGIAAHLNNDQPMELAADKYTATNYGGIVYQKSALVMAFLKDYLGEEVFDKAMHTYFNQWEYKHPQPADLRAIMESSSGKKLGWFFDDMLGTTKKIDYKICKATRMNDAANGAYKGTIVTVKNIGEILAPFEVSAYKNDSLLGSKWFAGFKGKQCVEVDFPDCDVLRINSENNCPEYNIKNNFIRTKGILRKSKPIKIQLLPGIDDPVKSQISVTPVLGYNYYNGVMPGIAIYNNLVPQKKFSYFLMPMYGTHDNSPAGFGRAGFTFLPCCKNIQLIWIGASMSQFAYAVSPLDLNFTKIVPEILVRLKNKNPRSTLVSEFRFRNFNIRKDILAYTMVDDSSGYKPTRTSLTYYVNQLTFMLAEKRKINPYSFSIVAEQGNKFLKASAEGLYKLTYNRRNKYLDVRAFFGGFIYQNASEIKSNLDFRYRIGSMNGSNDYLFDHYFIGRSEGSGLLSKQFCETDGGFKTITYLGETWKWLGAINIKSTIPGRIPIKLFADIGTYEGAGLAGTNTFVYDAGLDLSIISNIFEVYLPLAISGDIRKTNKLSGITHWQENIRFTLNLEKIDPFKLLREIR